jgi:hypothetical protein
MLREAQIYLPLLEALELTVESRMVLVVRDID